MTKTTAPVAKPRPTDTFRKVEVRHRGRWCLTSDGLASIKACDEFRMYEPDGTRVLTPGGSAIHVAVRAAIPVGDNWGVATQE